MLRIKLSRRGKKKQPIYRLLVIEREKDPYGTYIENVGTYNPRTEPNTLELKEDRIKYWISVGAQPTDTVHNLLVGAGVISEKKRNVSKLGKKYQEKLKEAEEKEKAPKEEKPSDEPKAEESKPQEKKKEPKAEEAKPAEETKTEEKKEKPKADSDKSEEKKPDASDSKKEEKAEEKPAE